MSDTVIHIDRVSKRYKGSAVSSLDDVSLYILKGEKFGIFGPNGAGKTTLISLLCGLFEPTSGTVAFELNGTSNTPRQVRAHIGYVPQEYAFFQELTPVQNLRYFGALHGIASSELNLRITQLLQILGLEHVANTKTHTFSGGMKRRVNLAIGIINDPAVLFLDEPTVGVDVQSKTAIMDYLETLNANGTTIIYTSHHLTEAEEFCDRIALLDHGKLVAFDTLEQLFRQHGVGNLEQFFLKLTGTDYRD